MVPLFKARKIFFPIEKKSTPELAEAVTELSLVTPAGFKSKHDDFADTISMLSSLTPWKPSEEAPMTESHTQGGMWDIDVPNDSVDRMASYIV